MCAGEERRLVKHLLQLALHHDHALALGRVPHVLQVVDALRPGSRSAEPVACAQTVLG